MKHARRWLNVLCPKEFALINNDEQSYDVRNNVQYDSDIQHRYGGPPCRPSLSLYISQTVDPWIHGYLIGIIAIVEALRSPRIER